MPRGGSTFSKRQKEQVRQQRQREKAERRTQRKQGKTSDANLDDEMDTLRENAEAQAALFHLNSDQPARDELPAASEEPKE
jgi:hypothetical protein